ncbi:HEXXH motif domain-containing protein [Micromonospora sp. WMMD1155]|uniref:HEXXH motif domain-containing protein n=1 Tax=Micromonospora sp. WMMD1155 TaxID=3016094 RepID=UPI00249B406E|nr:HEXXH motif domain-containing protein [Micromonospora sp. WMMD1155]WFE50119.1 HEXXH motif domain-containing protein [Micromonospora sp. WMMD1155]
MTGYHRLTPDDLAALAAGLGDQRTIRLLRDGQVSKRMLQLRVLLDTVDSEETHRHFGLWATAAGRSPEAGPAVLALPHTGAWLAGALRRLRSPTPSAPAPDAAAGRTTGGLVVQTAPEPPVEAELTALGSLAAVAALRAGMDFELSVVPRDGAVYLPTLGLARVGEAQRVTISRVGSRLLIGPVEVSPAAPSDAGPGAETAGWSGLHRLRSTADGLTLRITLDDLDPYRDRHRLCAAERLTPAEVAEWQRLLDDAWPILVRHHRRHAEAIAEGLGWLVPLVADSVSAGVNVTSMDAFGSVSMTRPIDGQAFALGLLHEFQHAKLGATLDVEPLYDRDDRRYYYAPWRDDPRPLGAALQGVYAFIAVTEFWRGRRALLSGGPARMAEVEFARWRDRVSRTCADIESFGRLTPAGREFVAGLRRVIDDWRDPVDQGAAELAREAAEDHWTVWRLRNRRPDPHVVNQLAAARAAGLPCPAVTVVLRVEPADGRWLSLSPRLDLVRLRLTDPERFRRLRTGAEPLVDALPTASDGDLALAAGDDLAARESYRRQVCVDPELLSAWVGLALAEQRLAAAQKTGGADPELCRAVYRQLRTDGHPEDPLELARWLAPVTCVAAPGIEPDGQPSVTSVAVPDRS